MKINIIGNNAFAHSLKMAFTVLNYDVEIGLPNSIDYVMSQCFSNKEQYYIVCDGKFYTNPTISNIIMITSFQQIFYKKDWSNKNTVINCSLENYDLMIQERPEAGIDKIKGMKLFITKQGATEEQIELVKKVFAGTGMQIDFKETTEEVNTVFYKRQLDNLKSGKISMKELQPLLEVDEKSFVNALKI